MNCPHCGAPVSPGNRFCNRCRKRVTPDTGAAPGGPSASGSGPQPARRPPSVPRPSARGSHGGGSFTRPGIVTLLAVLNIIGGVFGIGAGLLFGFGAMSVPAGPEAQFGWIFTALGALYGVLGALNVATGVGLLGLKPWARTLQIVLASIALLGIPCGTVIGILILVYMLKPEVKLLFSGASPQDLDPEELAMVERLGQGSGAVVALVAVLVVFVGIAGVGIVAAIAIPSLLRARVSANESAAIGDVRTVISAEAAYASSNGGFGDTLECLAAPTRCIPGYPDTGPVFLDATFATPMRRGYSFRFVAGPAAAAEAAPGASVSPSSMRTFAYIAEPLTPGQTGVRAFCGEASGIICVSRDGRIQDEGDGGCPVGCEPLG
jgi:type II secretory pathway pseudopilin PulG